MKNAIAGLGLASVLALGSAGMANAQEMMHKMTFLDCNMQYGQCLAGADYTPAMTPAEGVAKTNANAGHLQQCGNALEACYASLK